MAEGTYGSVAGIVQEFPDQDIIVEREVSGQTVREFKIRSITSGQLAKVTVWPETDEFTLQRGQLVGVDGKITVNEVKGTTYRNISASTISLSPVVGRSDGTKTVNKKKNEAIEQSEDVAF